MSKVVAALLSVSLAVMPCLAQQQTVPAVPPTPAESANPLQIRAGTALSVVLTGQLSSNVTQSGDPVHAQIIDPVVAEDQIAIPAGTYLQGTIGKISQHNGRVYFELSSASLIYVNGYVAEIAGPVELRSDSGWLRPAPTSHPAATVALFLAPVIGAGLGAGIGAATNPGSSGGITNTPGGPVLTQSTLPGTAKGAAIGGGIGAAVMFGGLLAILGSHGVNYFLHVGSPMTVELHAPVPLDRDRALDAVGWQQPTMVPLARLPEPPLAPQADRFPPTPPSPPPAPPTIIPGTPPSGSFPGTPTIVIP
jgi:hypothetical protein